jgi:hypothetical protein
MWFGILHLHMKLRAAEASLLDLFDRELILMDIEQSQLSAQVFEAKARIDQCPNGGALRNSYRASPSGLRRALLL